MRGSLPLWRFRARESSVWAFVILGMHFKILLWKRMCTKCKQLAWFLRENCRKLMMISLSTAIGECSRVRTITPLAVPVSHRCSRIILISRLYRINLPISLPRIHLQKNYSNKILSILLGCRLQRSILKEDMPTILATSRKTSAS